MTEHLVDILAREKSGQGPEWSVCTIENLAELKALRFTGAVAPLVTRGPNKGRRNWRKLDRATERTVYITAAERAAYEAAWEQTTGDCSRCMGKARVPGSSRKLADGTYEHTDRDCPRCGGSGKAVVVAEKEATS